MFQTEYGPFDGDSWEAFCQKCLKIRHINDDYLPMPAHFNGDLGIEGFTRDGIVYQCYCPDENYGPKELYEHQRDKIRDDLKKLVKYQKEHLKYMGNIKIKKWIFLTPVFHNKDLVKYCAEKREEYKSKKLNNLDQEFDVLIQDIEFFIPQIPIVLNGSDLRINIHVELIEDKEIIDWSAENLDLVFNVRRKTISTFPIGMNHQEDNINKIINNRIKEFRKGIRVLSKLEKMHQEQYERLLKVISNFETEVEEACMYPSEKNNKIMLDDIRNDLRNTLKVEFENILDSLVIEDITRYVISDWLLRCPIDFVS